MRRRSLRFEAWDHHFWGESTSTEVIRATSLFDVVENEEKILIRVSRLRTHSYTIVLRLLAACLRRF